MNGTIRTGIAAVAATVAIGGIAIVTAGVASADEDPDTVAKREDTASSWVVAANDDNGNGNDDADDPTDNTGPSNTNNTDNTKNTKDTKNTGPTNTKNTKDTKNTGPTNTKNTGPTDDGARR